MNPSFVEAVTRTSPELDRRRTSLVFQGSLLDAFERGRSGPPCETVEGPCVSLYAHGAAKHISTRHTCDALCQDAFGDVIQGNTLVPVVFDAKRLTESGCTKASKIYTRYQLRKNDNLTI